MRGGEREREREMQKRGQREGDVWRVSGRKRESEKIRKNSGQKNRRELVR